MNWRRPVTPIRFPGGLAQRCAIRQRKPAHYRAIRALIVAPSGPTIAVGRFTPKQLIGLPPAA